MKKIIIYSDGGARGNPGHAGIGAVLQEETGAIVHELSEYIGETTNNQAEYRALLRGLDEAARMGAHEVELYVDSELVAKQLTGEYNVKHKDLQPLFLRAWNMLQRFKRYSVRHIPRSKNARADALANQAMDKKSSG